MGKSSLPPERSDTPGTHPSPQVGLSLPPDAQHRGVLKSRALTEVVWVSILVAFSVHTRLFLGLLQELGLLRSAFCL